MNYRESMYFAMKGELEIFSPYSCYLLVFVDLVGWGGAKRFLYLSRRRVRQKLTHFGVLSKHETASDIVFKPKCCQN